MDFCHVWQSDERSAEKNSTENITLPSYQCFKAVPVPIWLHFWG